MKTLEELAKNREYIRDFRAKRRALGLCWRCDNPRRPKAGLCDDHRRIVTGRETLKAKAPWKPGVECLRFEGLPVLVAVCSDESSVYVCRHDLPRDQRRTKYKIDNKWKSSHWAPKSSTNQVSLPAMMGKQSALKRAEVLRDRVLTSLALAGLPDVRVTVRPQPWPVYVFTPGITYEEYVALYGDPDPPKHDLNRQAMFNREPVDTPSLPWGKATRVPHKHRPF